MACMSDTPSDYSSPQKEDSLITFMNKIMQQEALSNNSPKFCKEPKPLKRFPEVFQVKKFEYIGSKTPSSWFNEINPTRQTYKW